MGIITVLLALDLGTRAAQHSRIALSLPSGIEPVVQSPAYAPENIDVVGKSLRVQRQDPALHVGQSRLSRDESLIDDAGVVNVDVPCLEEPLDVLPRRNSYGRLKSGFAQGL